MVTRSHVVFCGVSYLFLPVGSAGVVSFLSCRALADGRVFLDFLPHDDNLLLILGYSHEAERYAYLYANS